MEINEIGADERLTKMTEKCLRFKHRYWSLMERLETLIKESADGKILLNKDVYPTLRTAREAYHQYQNGCTALHWCMLPFDEWMYSADRRADMACELSKVGTGGGK